MAPDVDRSTWGCGAGNVPEIDTPLLLDILLGLIVLLFVPFGVRRGVAKEAMVSAGILFGTVLAERFAEPWGVELAARFGIEPGVAEFVASVLLLFGSTFLLGYGGGAALGASRAGTLSRLVGGLLAAFNAALLLSYLLRWIEDLLQQGAALDDGIVSDALLRRTDLLLLGGAGVLLALTIIGWFVNASRSRRQPREHEGSMAASSAARQRPVRVASAADAGKFEPGSDPVERSGRFGGGLDATSPMAASGGAYAPWVDATHANVATNGNGRGNGFPVDGAARFAPSPNPPDETLWAPWNSAASVDRTTNSELTSQWPVSPTIGVTDDERCAICHAQVGPRDVFCPECGATL